MPTPAEARLKATLAQVKMAPAQANQPVRYDANDAYFLGANSLAQKYWPPAFGMADANSDRLTPTQVETKAIQGMP